MIIHRLRQVGFGSALAGCLGIVASPAVAGSTPASSTTSMIHNAAHTVVTSVNVGATVHNLVIVAGAPGGPVPTGEVDIAWFVNGQCSGPPVASSGPLALDPTGQFDATTFAFTVNSAGFNSFQAQYLGDFTYAPSVGPCETLEVDAETNDVGVVTHVKDAGGTDVTGTTVTAGTVVHDEATVTRGPNTPAEVPDPTGTVTFTLFQGGSCNGSLVATDPNAPINAAGLATSVSFTTPTAGGTFSYLANYSGDANYPQHEADCESFTVAANTVTVVTHVRDTGGNEITGATVPAGTVTHDEATVAKGAGTPAAVPNPTGTVSFTLFGGGTCNGTVIETDPNEPLNAAGLATSVTFTTPTAGERSPTFAHYNGDANFPQRDADCESITVAANIATVTTHVRDAAGNDVTGEAVNAGTVLHDEASVARTAGTPAVVPDPTGTVDFTLYGNGTCDGTVIATDPGKPLSGGTATSANFTTPATGGVFSYRAHYSGDAHYVPQDGACEPVTAQIGKITLTDFECPSILAGTAPALGQVTYSAVGGKIAQGLSPGAFYYWTKITTTVPNQVVTVTQSNTSVNNAALFGVLQGWDRVYTSTCGSWKAGTLIANGSGASFTIGAPGTYFVGIKYATKSIAGTVAPVPANLTYRFTTSLGGVTGGSVLLKKGN